MIFADLRSITRYKEVIPYFSELLDFLQSNDLQSKEKGKISIVGDELFVNIVDLDLKSKEDQVLEAHYEYLDIHIPLNREEIIGWKAIEDCANVSKPYEEENDCVFFSDKPTVYFTLKPGQFCVVYPEDAHAPAIGQGAIRKAIVKIKISRLSK